MLISLRVFNLTIKQTLTKKDYNPSIPAADFNRYYILICLLYAVLYPFKSENKIKNS